MEEPEGIPFVNHELLDLTGLSARDGVMLGVGAVRKLILDICDALDADGIEAISAASLRHLMVTLDAEWVNE